MEGSSYVLNNIARRLTKVGYILLEITAMGVLIVLG